MVRKQLHALLGAGVNPLNFFDKDYAKYFYLAECLALVDLSLMVKLGVQYSLWGGSVVNLGTEMHKRKYASLHGYPAPDRPLSTSYLHTAFCTASMVPATPRPTLPASLPLMPPQPQECMPSS